MKHVVLSIKNSKKKLSFDLYLFINLINTADIFTHMYISHYKQSLNLKCSALLNLKPIGQAFFHKSYNIKVQSHILQDIYMFWGHKTSWRIVCWLTATSVQPLLAHLFHYEDQSQQQVGLQIHCKLRHYCHMTDTDRIEREVYLTKIREYNTHRQHLTSWH
jgi:hypothetical protein